MDNALRIFHEKGCDSVSVEQITRAAGMVKGTFYTYFETKSDIIVKKFWRIDRYYKEYASRNLRRCISLLTLRKFAIYLWRIHWLSCSLILGQGSGSKWKWDRWGSISEQQNIWLWYVSTEDDELSVSLQIYKFRYNLLLLSGNEIHTGRVDLLWNEKSLMD